LLRSRSRRAALLVRQLRTFSVGKTSSGATDIFYSGTVTPNIAIGAAGITPQLTTATAITES
jgi:hypothetical protein